MKVEKAIEILEQHNKWRRGEGEINEMPFSPYELGKAIDVVVFLLPRLKQGNDRYEKLRKVTPARFDALYQDNMRGKKFDDLVDEL